MRKVSWGRLVATATLHLVILTQSHPTVNSLSIPQRASDGASPVTRSDSASVVLHKEILLEKPQQVEGLSLADRIRWGESALEVCLKGKIHCTDCHEISQACILQAAAATAKNTPQPLVRLPTQMAARRAAATQTPFAAPLSSDLDDKVQNMMRTIIVAISEIPSLTSVLFSGGTDQHNDHGSILLDLWDKEGLVFASREPAVNVYTQGGEFLPHQDGQTLTLLFPLSLDTRQDYQGGGTALWGTNIGPRVEPPTVVWKPEEESPKVLLFGGSLMHAGLPVTLGNRVVLVASFSKKK